MESPVTGHPPLGELRQAYLAVLVGNPLFTPEEQLLANHQAHDCEAAPVLAAWLREARHLDAARSWDQRLRLARYLPQPGLCLDQATQDAEVAALVHCRRLDKYQRRLVLALAGNPLLPARTRLRFLGEAYHLLLTELGGYAPRPRGFEALYDN